MRSVHSSSGAIRKTCFNNLCRLDGLNPFELNIKKLKYYEMAFKISNRH